MEIDRSIKDRKEELLNYFRNRASESLNLVRNKFAENQPSHRAKAINEAIIASKQSLISTLRQKSDSENWSNLEKLECLLMINYCNIVIMIESRNSVRAYEYMDFSRRVGELWDPFCKLCFYYPINNIQLFVPPLFSDVKKQLTDEIIQYINKLNISGDEKAELKAYYEKVWSLVTSGEIQLELDLHFIYEDQKYVVDFKSGFGSNEKGNTNRLLLVASIYNNMVEKYNCLQFVRAEENNSYFNILKKSGVWDAYCGKEAYSMIYKYSGYDLKTWIDKNVNWANDFNQETTNHLDKMKLLQYLIW